MSPRRVYHQLVLTTLMPVGEQSGFTGLIEAATEVAQKTQNLIKNFVNKLVLTVS